MHVLSGIRQCLFAVVARRYPGTKPLLRDPSDSRQAIAARGGPRGKAMAVATLALRFGAGARRRGLPTNRGLFGILPLRRERSLRRGAGSAPCASRGRATSSCATPAMPTPSLRHSIPWWSGGAWSMRR